MRADVKGLQAYQSHRSQIVGSTLLVSAGHERKHAAAGAMDSPNPKLLHSHRIHFSENNEASLVFPAAAFFAKPHVIRFCTRPLFTTFGVVTTLLPVGLFYKTGCNSVLHPPAFYYLCKL